MRGMLKNFGHVEEGVNFSKFSKVYDVSGADRVKILTGLGVLYSVIWKYKRKLMGTGFHRSSENNSHRFQIGA